MSNMEWAFPPFDRQPLMGAGVIEIFSPSRRSRGARQKKLAARRSLVTTLKLASRKSTDILAQ